MEGVASSSEAGRGPHRDSPAGSSRLTLLVRRAARRLPPEARSVIRAGQRRARLLAGRLRRRWHRSLQLRVVATTLLICVVVATVLGFFLVQQIAAGLLNSTRTAAAHQISEGLDTAKNDAGLEGTAGDQSKALIQLAADLQGLSGPGDTFDVVILTQTSDSSAFVGIYGNRNLSPASLPRKLIASVTQEQQKGRTDDLVSTPTQMSYLQGRVPVPGLAIGGVISPHAQLYYLFPMDSSSRRWPWCSGPCSAAG